MREAGLVRIEAVSVCVNYSDFLAETAAQNRGMLDRWIIVTSRTDEATVDLCHRLNLECIRTDDFFKDGSQFNKGRAIDRGLGMLGHDEWLLHIDADIALPTDFRESLLDADLDTECLYGADRHMLSSWEEWQAWKTAGSTRSYHCYQQMTKWPVGALDGHSIRLCTDRVLSALARICRHQEGRATPCYPEWHSNAARADVKFALQWDRRRRQVLPEVIVAHLESGASPMVRTGTDGNRRRLQPRLPKPPPRKIHRRVNCKPPSNSPTPLRVGPAPPIPGLVPGGHIRGRQSPGLVPGHIPRLSRRTTHERARINRCGLQAAHAAGGPVHVPGPGKTGLV